MSDVKWIKITTDMFDNRKIKHLRKLPDGNNIVLIWVMLLTMAGRCNAGGMIFLTERIPYTTKMLADELGFEETTVQLALTALEEFNMVVRENGGLFVTGWNEYQNTDGLEKIREQNRLRQAKYKQKQKALSSGNVTDNVMVTQGNATDKEKEKEKEKEIGLSTNLSEGTFCGMDRVIDPAAISLIKNQIEYEILADAEDQDLLDTVVRCIAELYAANGPQEISGYMYSREFLRRRALEITSTHVEYVLNAYKQQHEKIRNVKAYIKTSVFNAPDTMGAFYTNQVRADGLVY